MYLTCDNKYKIAQEKISMLLVNILVKWKTIWVAERLEYEITTDKFQNILGLQIEN